MDLPRTAADDGAPASSSAAQADLAELLGRSARGDRAAFATLYDTTSARLYGLVLRVVRVRSHADEVTQEAYLEIWRNASRFDADRGSALSWMMTICHRRAVDRVRAAEAAGRRDSTYLQHNQTVSHDATSESVIQALDAQRVRAALGQLTAVQREAIELAYFGGYTHTEIAVMLDLPLGTAKTRIRDGLIRLRDTIGVGQ